MKQQAVNVYGCWKCDSRGTLKKLDKDLYACLDHASETPPENASSQVNLTLFPKPRVRA